MCYIRTLALGVMALLSTASFGQTANTVFGSSYSLPAALAAAPGQILNLQVAGVGANLTVRVAATSLPLPNMLAGITVQMTQSLSPQSVAMPILAVRPVSTCIGLPLGSAPCGHYAVVTVQIPYELVAECPLCAAAVSNVAQLVVSENGVPGGVVTLTPNFDQVHVTNACDLDTAATLPCGPAPLITHPDGSLVTTQSPAHVGEEIVIYALGLGRTTPMAQTGQASPLPAAVTQNIRGVIYNYGINLPPSQGVPAPFATCAIGTGCPAPPAFSGLTPGAAGLYQVNFVIPPSPNIFPCGAGVVSNLTLSIVGSSSYDGAGICVEPPAVAGTGQ